MKYLYLYASFLISFFYTSCEQQNKSAQSKENIKSAIKVTTTSSVPNSITRNIIQDQKGNIWLATWEGIFRYDGKAFTNITTKISSARFFSILQDRKGNFWFGSIGAGIYFYDGHKFQNFTIRDGLLSNDVTHIYEDKKGNIWFGVYGGASKYDGKSFRNYIIDGDVMNEDRTGKTFSNRPAYEVNSIVEDKIGRFWLATRGNTFSYDGKTFTIFKHNDKPFTNVRSLIEDKKGNIWLGGKDGLWCYDGKSFTNLTQQFVGYIYADRKGNIWTGSENPPSKNWHNLQNAKDQQWALSKYDEQSLTHQNPKATNITYKPMIFGILQANDGSIWFGSFGGVYRYDGKNIINLKSKTDQK